MGYILNDIAAVISVLIFASSISIFIVVLCLNRSNNFGDNFCGFKDYSTPIRIRSKLVDVSEPQGSRFVTEFGDNPFKYDNSKAPEILKANEEEDIFGDLPDVDIPLFVPSKKTE
ncbi:MAG: hypothetical protein II718_00625 [Clostridiales bacterium]|nr:hypothetical protein [Clostridiales bacterium]